MSWHLQRMALFDTETSGVDPHRDRIVTAAVILVGGGRPTETREWLLNPGMDIPAEATAVHGITTEHARDHGADPAEGVAQIAHALLGAIDQGAPIVGHNVGGYDLTMLAAELVRHGHLALHNLVAAIRPVIDTMVIERHLDRFRPGKPNGRRPDSACGPHTLLECCRLWGIDLTEQDAHGAAADALAAGRLAWRLATDPNRFAQFDSRPTSRINPADWPLDRLHQWQAEQYAETAASFQAYKRGEQRSKPEEVDPEFVANTVWPVQAAPPGWSPEQLPAERAVA